MAKKKQPNTYTIKIKQLGDKIRGKIMQSMRQFNLLEMYSPTIPIFKIKPQIMQTTQMLIIDLITAPFCM